MSTRSRKSHVSRKAYDARVPHLREELVQLQVKLKEKRMTMLLVLAGVEGAGRGDVINTLSSWLDPRGVETIGYHKPTEEEREHPWMWRYWRTLPTTGKIGIYAESWYTEALRAETHDPKQREHVDRELERIRHFEKLLSDDGVLILKLWLHLGKDEQRERFRELESNEDTAWRVSADDWKQHHHYERLARFSENILARTDRAGARWHTIDATHERSRDLAVAELLVSKFRVHGRRFSRPASQAKGHRAQQPIRPAGMKRLAAVPMDRSLSADEYDHKREKWLGKLHRAVTAAIEAKRSIVFVFEGWDAAGKGGAIRRLTSAIDARDYRVISIAKPTDEEKAHHYLWRFWRHLPSDGITTVFDRSWYGRVLVERVEGFARPDEWRRAFAEIRDFEEQLVYHGTIVVKFWLQISREEQLRRFREREKTPYKRHKMTEEDWRNRGKWSAYEVAAGDMLALTDHDAAHWHLIPAEEKRYARLEVLKTACHEIETALGI